MSEVHQYTTQDADLATFLLYEGIELPKLERNPHNEREVLMHFHDPLGKCRDLEFVYLRSDFKQFRDINKQLLKRIHQTLRG